jgi:regulator of replication initiation timing
MKTTTLFSTILAVALLLTGCGGEARKLQAENESLRVELAELKARSEAEAQSTTTRDAEFKRLQADAREVVRLHGEITQLRSGSKDAESLRAENQRLKSENQALRSAGTAAATPAPTTPSAGDFPRESWAFAGYQSPEAALISAIWSMQQGNPKQYFESLTTDEQARMAKVWEGKSNEEIAAKHVSDTSKITSIKVLGAQETAPGQMVMSVYIGGVDRAEKVNMQRVGNDWKFGGFIREPKP